jgi:putative N-acetylmannosamine-6-phosphate epimerase
MKFQNIEIGGKLRPVRFSYAALYEYERNTGRNAIADFSKLQESQVSVTIAADLIFAGLTLGSRTNGYEPDFTVYDVADWAFSDPNAITKAMEIFSESFPKTGTAPEDGEGEKKPKARHGTT